MRRKQRRGLAKALRKLHQRVAAGRLKQRDKILEALGRLKARYPKACPFTSMTVTATGKPELRWSWKVDKFKAALAADGAYLLRIRGESMKNAGILEGDFVVVRPQETAQDGDIVVALLGEEATVKRFFRESDHVRLQPENEAMDAIRSKEVKVLGRVVGLLRSV